MKYCPRCSDTLESAEVSVDQHEEGDAIHIAVQCDCGYTLAGRISYREMVRRGERAKTLMEIFAGEEDEA